MMSSTGSAVCRYACPPQRKRRREYDPDGKIVNQSITPEVKYLFTNQELESNVSTTSFWYFRARAYDSEIGLFYATDPEGQTYSPFGYVAGNPISLIDPTGRTWVSGGGGPHGDPFYSGPAWWVPDPPADPLSMEQSIAGDLPGKDKPKPLPKIIPPKPKPPIPPPVPPLPPAPPQPSPPQPAPVVRLEPVQTSQNPMENAMFSNWHVIDMMWQMWVATSHGRRAAEASTFVQITNWGSPKVFQTTPMRINNSGAFVSVNFKDIPKNPTPFAYLHIHPTNAGYLETPSMIATSPDPQKNDEYTASKLGIPVYAISDKGIWVVEPNGNVREVTAVKWILMLSTSR